MNDNFYYIENENKPTPKVLKWYKAYCVMIGLMYLLMLGVGICLLVIDPSILGTDPSDLEKLEEIKIQSVIMVVLGLVFAIPYSIAPFLPKKPWVWVYGIVLIGITMSSCCLLPLAIPLLIYWIKPETKYWYGKT
ncbi:MAG: hypothetical protein WAQ98_33445 [Blastocatellia bacterium]